jgi:hypothetical protein
MSIFSNHKTIVAVFDSDQELEQVTQQLNSRGLIPEDEDAFTIIDPAADDAVASEDRPFAVPAAIPTNTGGSGIGGVPVILNPVHHTDDNRIDNSYDTESWLTDKGLDDDDASYYAMQVKRGGKVLILEADKDHVSEIVNLIEPMSERVTVA